MYLDFLTMLYLTHICLVDPSIFINWASPFSIIGVSEIFFHFIPFQKLFLLANSEDPDLIWDCTVCQCPKNGSLGLHQLNGPRQANLVLIAYAGSEGSGETARIQNLRCSLIQAVSQEEPSDRKPNL